MKTRAALILVATLYALALTPPAPEGPANAQESKGKSANSYGEGRDGGVHFNSGIQNKAFYLLAEGGTHPQSGITVSGIGREAAERIFYRALDTYLWSSSQFIDVRNACVSAAADIYGYGSQAHTSAQQAWCAVGVGTCGSQGGINNATFISQYVPTSMVAGNSYGVSVTMRNSGTTTWTSDSYRLGSQNPQDNFTWGLNRVYLPAGTTVPPGSDYTFYFTVTAPASAGYYNFQWRMVQDGVEWFGDYTPNVLVNVTAGTGCDPYLRDEYLTNGGRWNSTYCTCRYIDECSPYRICP